MYNIELIKKYDEEVTKALELELARQRENIELIASENFVSEPVMAAMGTHLTNKYAEGYPGKRYYGGCQFVDIAEDIARDRLKEIFGAGHANVQPHSGSQANLAVFYACMEPGDTYLGMSLPHGGHLSHGSPVNISGKYYKAISYGVGDDGYIDYDEVERLAVENKPKLIIAGASAYSREIDFEKFGEIAKKVGAYLMVDIAHIAGLVAAGLHQNPVPYADFVTSTTHKTLRGPRGGFILCKEEYAKMIDKAIFPGIQGGPLMHIIGAKAVCFGEALKDEFKDYQKQVVKNAKALSESLMKRGYDIVSGGTDNHLMLVDLTSHNMTGKEAEHILDEVKITCNKNTVPNDKQSPFVTSGIRLGTPAVTTRGMKEKEMEKIAEIIDLSLSDFEKNADKARAMVKELVEAFPLY